MIIGLAILKKILFLVGIWLTIRFGVVILIRALRGQVVFTPDIGMLSAGVALIISYFIF